MVVIKNYKAFTQNRKGGEITLLFQKPRQHRQKIISVRYIKSIQYSVTEALKCDCFGSQSQVS